MRCLSQMARHVGTLEIIDLSLRKSHTILTILVWVWKCRICIGRTKKLNKYFKYLHTAPCPCTGWTWWDTSYKSLTFWSWKQNEEKEERERKRKARKKKKKWKRTHCVAVLYDSTESPPLLTTVYPPPKIQDSGVSSSSSLPLSNY